MTFTHTTPIINKKDITSASFESDPPFEYGWARSGSLSVYGVKWGNVDNQLIINVYWGTQQNGAIPIRSNIVWKQDTSLTVTLSASGGIDTNVSAVLDIPIIKGRYMKLVCTLSGTTKEVDVFGWFHGSTSGAGGSSGSGGIQYADGDSVAVPTGNVVLWRSSGTNSVLAAADNAPLPVVDSTANTSLNNIDSNISTVVLNTNGLALESGGNLFDIKTRLDSFISPTGTVINTYSTRITTNTTITVTSSTAYISSIAISSEVAGTTSTLTIQDKSGTPLKLVNGLTTVAVTTIPTILNFQTPIKMTSGIDIITAGAVAATLDLWIDYYQ